MVRDVIDYFLVLFNGIRCGMFFGFVFGFGFEFMLILNGEMVVGFLIMCWLVIMKINYWYCMWFCGVCGMIGIIGE